MRRHHNPNKVPPFKPDPEHWTRKVHSWKAKVAYETDDDAWEFLNQNPKLLAQGMAVYRCIPKGKKVAMFLKLTFLEGKARRALFRSTPPIRVWVSSSRLKCAPNGDFNAIVGSAAAYAWFVWEKGYNGETTVKWFN